MRYKKYLLYIAWIQAMMATGGSLIFSEVLHFLPCNLCWWQRVFIYPLTLILPIGIIKKDKFLPYYVLSLSFLGTAFAFYQNLLVYKIIPEKLAPCTIGTSCAVGYISYFGFVTIPLLSLVAFLVIDICMILYLKWEKRKA